MRLTNEEQAFLDGKLGVGAQKCMRILVSLGEIYGADRLIPVKKVQVAGVSYKNLGDEGIMFLEELAADGARVLKGVTATLNPAGSDLVDWAKVGFKSDLAGKQQKVIDAYTAIGITPTCTCLPYGSGFKPGFGEHIAWAESSCVIYANSVLGARTNREGGPSALAAAVTGRTPNYDLHLDEKRKPTFGVNVDVKLEGSDYGVMGWVIGKAIKTGIPYITGVDKPSLTDLKYFGAAMAAGGQIGLYHMNGVTPEAGIHSWSKDVLTFGKKELDEGYGKLSNSKGEEDVIYLGCPHLSIEEIRDIAGQLKGRKVSKRLMLVTSRIIKNQAVKEGLVSVIEKAGGEIYADMCLVIGNIEQLGFKSLVTNSGKAAHYLPHYAGVGIKVLSTKACVLEALK